MTAPYNVTAETVQGVVQGEHNTVNLTINNYSADGALVTSSDGPAPGPRARPSPVRVLPRAFPDLLGRGPEVEAAVAALGSQRPLEISGQAGVGKSALLRHLAHHPCTRLFVGGVVFREYRNEPVADLVQKLFEAFYESDVKFTDTRIRSYLQDTQALVIVDDAELGRDQLETLGNTMPSSVLVLASQQPLLLGEGRQIALHGLADVDALALLERRLDRALEPGEHEAGVALCRAVDGNPLRIVQAAALLLQDRDLRLDDLVGRIGTGTTGLDAVVLGATTAEERVALGALAPFGDTPVDALHVERMTGIPAAAVLASLEDRGLVRSSSPRYSVVAPVRDVVLGDGPSASETTRMLGYLSSMVKDSGPLKPGDQDVDVVVAATRIAAADGHWPEVLTLARSLDGALALDRRWGAWESTLRLALRASEATHDLSGQGWARHQLGTRALCLEDYHEAGTELRLALQLRDALGDSAGLAATRANLDTLELLARSSSHHESKIEEITDPPSPWPRLLRVVGAVVVAVAVALVVVVLARSGGGGEPAVTSVVTSPSVPVTDPPTARLVVRALEPSVVGAGARQARLVLNGEGFGSRAEVSFAGGDIEVDDVRRVSDRRLDLVVSVAGTAEPGRRDVRVSNPGGATAACPDCLAVAPGPGVTTVRPAEVSQGATEVVVTVVGSGFAATPTLTVDGRGVTVTSVSGTSAGLLRAVVSVDGQAATGPRDVSVTNPDGGTGSCAGCLTVTEGPEVTSVEPGTVQQGTRRTLAVRGAGFAGTPDVDMGAGIDVRAVRRTSARELAVTIVVDADAPVGSRAVTVTNPDRGASTCGGCLTVKQVQID